MRTTDDVSDSNEAIAPQEPEQEESGNKLPEIRRRSADQIIVYTQHGNTPLDKMRPELAYKWNDIGISQAYADVYVKECRYVTERKQWYVFDGKVWRPDNAGAMERAKELVAALLRYANSLPQPEDDTDKTREKYIEFVKRLQSRRARETILKDAASIYPISYSKFDEDPYILNCLNGTLDLHTFKLHPHNPDDLLSKIANVNYIPQARSQMWEQHMETVTEGDAELRKYIQKSLAYGITGNTDRECFFIIFGSTSRNGKGVTMESYKYLLGDYAMSSNPDTLAQKTTHNGSGPSEDIARLAGARVVSIAEPDKGMTLSNGLIKTLTGNDTITARFLHENSFEYKPSYKIFINTNYLPKTNDVTLFRSGRVKVIPFNHRFVGADQDINLKEKLRSPENLSGMLSWLLEGLRLLEAEGFAEPDAVKASIEEYAKDSDKVARFIEECLCENPCGEILMENAYRAFSDYCRMSGQFAESQAAFKQSLQSHNIVVKRARPRDKRLGANPRSLIQGYSWNPAAILQ